MTSNGIKIKDVRYETDSCIFCQASASILSEVVKSIPIKDLRNEILKFYDSFNKDKFILPKKYSLFKSLKNKK